MAENLDSFGELRQLLSDQNKSLVEFPLVLECNKSDLPGALPASEIAAVLHDPHASVVQSSAINGEGVFDALRDVSRQIAARL
jgi:signal recognition particle receptor subunit beta